MKGKLKSGNAKTGDSESFVMSDSKARWQVSVHWKAEGFVFLEVQVSLVLGCRIIDLVERCGNRGKSLNKVPIIRGKTEKGL